MPPPKLRLIRSAAILLTALAFTPVFAQGPYVGLNGGVLPPTSGLASTEVFFGVQFGGNITPHFAVRGSGDVLVSGLEGSGLLFYVSADFLYTGEIAADVTGYVGGGAGIAILFDPDFRGWVPTLHVTGGAEYRIIDEVGVYVEAQVIVIFPVLRAGVNYHF